MTDIAMSDPGAAAVAALKERFRAFINGEVIPLESLLDGGGKAAAQATTRRSGCPC